LGSWRLPFAGGLFDVQPLWRGEIGKAPAVDIVDTDKAYEITAELPGMEESNIDVKFSDGADDQRREAGRQGGEEEGLLPVRAPLRAFQRSFGVPDEVDADKIEANFKNGVLTVTLPKTPQTQKSEKKIAIKSA
jgi:HSP20 family protein